MFDLAKVDTTKIDAVMSSAITAWSGLGFVQFEPHAKIPYDKQMAPIAKVIGYSLLGLAAYQLWRSWILWKR